MQQAFNSIVTGNSVSANESGAESTRSPRWRNKPATADFFAKRLERACLGTAFFLSFSVYEFLNGIIFLFSG